MVEVVQTTMFSEWLHTLTDREARVRIVKRINRMRLGNVGDTKPVGSGILEARVHYGPGYRLYYLRHGEVYVVLLAGGDKRTQQEDIPPCHPDSGRATRKTMKTRLARFEAAEYLKTTEDVVAFLKATIEDGTPEELALALSDVVRAIQMHHLSGKPAVRHRKRLPALAEMTTA
jgi:putative addiction module killer protein